MKRTYLLVAAMLISHQFAFGQAPFATMDSLNINRLNAAVLVHGDMWWDPATQSAKCEFPAGSHKHVSSTAALWLSGYDGSNQLHVAAQTYRQDGNDYWPGPLDSAGALSYASSQKWAKIWKVSRQEINLFQSLLVGGSLTTTNMPADILTWPAKGNTYAAGNGGAALAIATDMAPFVDVNGNGTYEPLLGDYPAIIGDQALWWVFSDNGPTHTQTNGAPIGVEVHAMCYGYNRGTVVDNAAFYKFSVVNRSANNYTRFRAALFNDMDLGYYGDDYIGVDTSRLLAIGYNGSADDGGAAGHPVNSYGTNIPVMGVRLVGPPHDSVATAGPCFTYYNNDHSIIGNPGSAPEYDNYMRGKLKNGDPFTNDFAGSGVHSKGYGSGAATNAVFFGHPGDTTQWSECTSGNFPGDRRFVLSTPDFHLNAGQTKDFTYALVTTNPGPTNACPDVRFDSITYISDVINSVYISPLHPTGVTDLEDAHNEIKVYPNPASNSISIEFLKNNQNNYNIGIYNTLGQLVEVAWEARANKKTADISQLPAGVYTLKYTTASGNATTMFIKQ